MDFSTIERKLTASNPVKPDPNQANPRYNNAEEFVSDVRLIFSNSLTFNGPDHAVTAMGKRVEEIFDKQVKNMPIPLEVRPVTMIVYFVLMSTQIGCRYQEGSHSTCCRSRYIFTQEDSTISPSIYIGSCNQTHRN